MKGCCLGLEKCDGQCPPKPKRDLEEAPFKGPIPKPIKKPKKGK